MNENSTRLTKAKVQGHTHSGGRGILWDTRITGFGVRAYPSGKKAYVLSYRVDGRKRLLVLGSSTVLTLDQAEKRAQQELAKVSSGTDPIVERTRREKIESFRDLSERYIEKRAKPRKKTWKEDKRRIDQHVPGTWKSLPAIAINKKMVRAVHEDIGEAHPYEANRFLSLLSGIFKYADIEPNPARGIERFKEVSRKRFAFADEIKALAGAIDAEPNVYVRGAVWLYMLTGARREELLERRHTELDETRARLVLSDTKSGEEQFIPLSAPALAIIKALPKQEGNPFLFPGQRKGKHLVNIGKPWRAIRARAGVTDLRLHDLRRTVGAWLSQGGIDLNTIKETLRHKNIATTLVYARLGEDPGREALRQHGERMLEISGRVRAID